MSQIQNYLNFFSVFVLFCFLSKLSIGCYCYIIQIAHISYYEIINYQQRAILLLQCRHFQVTIIKQVSPSVDSSNSPQKYTLISSLDVSQYCLLSRQQSERPSTKFKEMKDQSKINLLNTRTKKIATTNLAVAINIFLSYQSFFIRLFFVRILNLNIVTFGVLSMI